MSPSTRGTSGVPARRIPTVGQTIVLNADAGPEFSMEYGHEPVRLDLTAVAVPLLTALEPGVGQQDWAALTIHTRHGVLVAVREHAGERELAWCGPPAPDSRVSWLRRRSLDGDLLVPEDPHVAVFYTAQTALRIYAGYVEDCRARRRTPPEQIRLVAVEQIRGRVLPVYVGALRSLSPVVGSSSGGSAGVR